jgi:hypothetical protein
MHWFGFSSWKIYVPYNYIYDHINSKILLMSRIIGFTHFGVMFVLLGIIFLINRVYDYMAIDLINKDANC